jgi:hypothetical protein
MKKWLKWFDDRNIELPRERFEREQKDEEASRAAEERWIDLMSQNFHLVWQRAKTAAEASEVIQIPDTKPLSQDLEQEFPDDGNVSERYCFGMAPELANGMKKSLKSCCLNIRLRIFWRHSTT